MTYFSSFSFFPVFFFYLLVIHAYLHTGHKKKAKRAHYLQKREKKKESNTSCVHTTKEDNLLRNYLTESAFECASVGLAWSLVKHVTLCHLHLRFLVLPILRVEKKETKKGSALFLYSPLEHTKTPPLFTLFPWCCSPVFLFVFLFYFDVFFCSFRSFRGNVFNLHVAELVGYFCTSYRSLLFSLFLSVKPLPFASLSGFLPPPSLLPPPFTSDFCNL